MRRKADSGWALFLLLGRHPNSKSLRIFFHQPADYALLEVDNDDDNQQTQGHELPAKEIRPGYFLNDLEHDGTDYGAPESALAAEQHHQDHENIKRRCGKGDVARVDKTGHVAEDRAGDTKKKRRYRPSRALVAARVQPHGLRLFLVIADGVDRQAKIRGIERAQADEHDKCQTEQKEIKKQFLRIRRAR